MEPEERIGPLLASHGISRRAFLKFCAIAASSLALPASAAQTMAEALAQARRRSVVWLSFQECTGCTESLTRSQAPTIERLILELLSLDYHHTLQAASGEAAERAREQALQTSGGRALLVVDGAVPLGASGAYCTIAGESAHDLLARCVRDAEIVIAVGTCAAFGGLPAAAPNPTGAKSVADLMDAGEIARRPLVNVPGCPPIPEAMAALFAYLIAFGKPPELDELYRPRMFYGETVHDRCSRRKFFEEGKFAKTFDDEGARNGWCLYELGCRGPVTHNACSTIKWNGGVSNPIESGHPCIGCSEPGFWDRDGFYSVLAPAPGAESGQALYESNCVYCHKQPASLRTPPDKVAELLSSGSVRSHRFNLSAEDLRALVEYLQEPSR